MATPKQITAKTKLTKITIAELREARAVIQIPIDWTATEVGVLSSLPMRESTLMTRITSVDEFACSGGQRKSNTEPSEQLSTLSDWLFGRLASQAADKYSSTIQTPRHFVEMLLLIEDKRFSLHPGLDPIAIIRAICFNARRTSRQGASTIPQQIATMGMARGAQLSRTYSYKLTQITRAIVSSITKSKVSLLTEYVNTVYWGRSYHGLDEAAKGYFGVQRTSLTPAASFFLAERIAAPNRVCPQRIQNLLERTPIKNNLVRNGATPAEVPNLYKHIYGGPAWKFQER